MKTTLSDQVKAIQNARKFTQDPTAWKNINLADLDEALNDAGATLAALNLTLKSFSASKGSQTGSMKEVRMQVAFEFFQNLNSLM